jgi:hypothetical protein
VICVPAAFALGIQITPPLVRLMAVLAMFANCLIEFRLRALDLTLALRVIVCVRLRHGQERRRTQSHRYNCRYRNFLNAL